MYILAVFKRDGATSIYLNLCETFEAAQMMLYRYIVERRDKIIDSKDYEVVADAIEEFFSEHNDLAYNIQPATKAFSLESARRAVEMEREFRWESRFDSKEMK